MTKAICLGACAAAFLGFAALPASAQEPGRFYGEAGYSRIWLSDDDLDFHAVTVRAGARFTRHFGAEVEGSIGVGDDQVTVSGFKADAALNYNIAAYGVVSTPVGPGEIYGRLGYAQAELEVDAGFGPSTGTADGVSGGLGYRVFPNDGRVGWRFDYTHTEYDDVGADALSVAFVARF
jgi:outer membrane immunogenic protein